MATSNIGKLIVIDDGAADQMIAQMDEQDANPQPYVRREIKWGDPKKLAEALSREYASEN
ncbi:MAG: hypothetical protein LBP28_04845 [Coriobacteriales bacterium]|jgi:hypothetical protein|nr:hypothetical protein [Coriobacteriales bacterium]